MAQVDALGWIHGPAVVPIGQEASITVPKGIKYLNAIQSKRFLELNGNPPAENNYVVAPEALTWFAVYEFNPSGYVSDTEKIDPVSLFDGLKKNQQTGNDERKSLGISALYLDRWTVEPHYDRSSHNLEWGTEMHDEHGEKIINYTSRILGRGGVMSAILVSDPNNFATDLPQFRAAVARFAYLPTKRYEEHEEGDKLAAYGLGALVTGGAAAVVVKSGLFAGILAILAKFGAVFFKVIIVGGLAVLVAVGNWVKNLFQRRSDNEQ